MAFYILGTSIVAWPLKLILRAKLMKPPMSPSLLQVDLNESPKPVDIKISINEQEIKESILNVQSKTRN